MCSACRPAWCTWQWHSIGHVLATGALVGLLPGWIHLPNALCSMQVVLAFRGTTDLNDMLTDACAVW